MQGPSSKPVEWVLPFTLRKEVSKHIPARLKKRIIVTGVQDIRGNFKTLILADKGIGKFDSIQMPEGRDPSPQEVQAFMTKLGLKYRG